MKKAIVLGADYAYADKVMTTIKSICAHNTNIKFYLLNQDFPVEWTRLLNQKLYQINSEIIDVKVNNEMIKSFYTFQHINYTTYLRYFIPQVVEEDVCLYLDADIIVVDNLDELFEVDLSDHYLAAVPDYIYKIIPPSKQLVEEEFNAGVLLINNKKWKDEKLTEKLLDATVQLKGQYANSDQSILSYVAGSHYVKLSDDYNFQIGADYMLYLDGKDDQILSESFASVKILHFLTYNKPWNKFSSGRLREYWWHYYDMEWSSILAKWSMSRVEKTQFARPYPFKSKHAFILTAVAEIEKLEYLLQELQTDVHFHIAAYTAMAPLLTNLVKYPNITLYPNIIPVTEEKLLGDCDVYLDINNDVEVADIVSKARENNKPVFAFDTTKHGENNQIVISSEQPEEMVKRLREL